MVLLMYFHYTKAYISLLETDYHYKVYQNILNKTQQRREEDYVVYAWASSPRRHSTVDE